MPACLATTASQSAPSNAGLRCSEGLTVSRVPRFGGASTPSPSTPNRTGPKGKGRKHASQRHTEIGHVRVRSRSGHDFSFAHGRRFPKHKSVAVLPPSPALNLPKCQFSQCTWGGPNTPCCETYEIYNYGTYSLPESIASSSPSLVLVTTSRTFRLTISNIGCPLSPNAPGRQK